MPANFILLIGFFAQFLFFSRMLHQWLQSEQEKKVVTPVLFWILSLCGSFVMFIYGLLRDDFAIMLGQFITYFIYIRNLQIQNTWQQIHKNLRQFLWFFPFGILLVFALNASLDWQAIFQNKEIPNWLLVLGILAQILFTCRFVYQWINAERSLNAKLPKGFWVISFLGSSLILVYGIFRSDLVLILSHSLGLIIYSRNLCLFHQSKQI